MSLPESYRRQHEKFVVNNSGISAWQCLLMAIPHPLLAFFSCYFVHHIVKTNNGLLRFFSEFSILIIPLMLTFTIFHDYVHVFVLTLLFGVILCVVTSLWNKSKNMVRIVFTLVTPVKSRPFITYFRSIVNIISVFCILAVDFHVFPREFAKTKSYGFSLMDMGVGFYVVANGIVTSPDTREGITKTLKSILPIIFVGVIRCIITKSVDYQVVVSEYGTHWNFFFTLGAVKLMGSLLMNIFPKREIVLSIITAVLHQFILSMVGVETWILSETPRTNPFSANREGICSMLGYLSLFLGSLSFGRAFKKKKVDLEEDLWLTSKGIVMSIALFGIMYFLNFYYPVSRRFANVTYIVWILSMSLLLLAICIILEISLRVIYFVNNIIIIDNLTPVILDSINYNGLLFFLLGNIFTGIINISIKTMNIENYNSFAILLSYIFLLCFICNILYRNKVKFSL